MSLLKSIFSIFLIGLVASLSAQDIHFSQFYMSPLNLNPAMTGVLNCKNRFAANYRNQWASVLGSDAYNTYSLSYDQKNPVGREDYFGIGGTIWSDVAGEAKYGMTQARLSGSYSKKMAGKRKSASYAVIGADLGVTQRKISTADLRWPSQITSNGFDVTLPGEVLDNTSKYYPDLSIGALWFSLKDEANYWYLGAAMAHVNRPNIAFLSTSSTLYSRITIHGGAEFGLSNKVSAMPFFLVMNQGPHVEYNFGSSLRFALGNPKLNPQSWEAGLYYRLGMQSTGVDGAGRTLHSDAVILQTKFNTGSVSYGFSYDINVSKLAVGSPGNGSLEFSVMYQICGPESRGVYCPRF